MTSVTQDPGASEPRQSTFERRARLILLIDLAVIAVVAVVVAPQATTSQLATIRVALGLVVGAVSTVSVLVALYGLTAWKPWASTAAALVLLFGNLGAGLVEAFTALGRGGFTIPILGIVAAWVLVQGVGQERWSWSRPALIVGILAVTSLIIGPVGDQFITAGVIAAPQSALELTVTVDCKTGSAAMGPFALVTARWHWRSREPLPGPNDLVTLSWATSSGAVAMLDATGSAGVLPGVGAGWLEPSPGTGAPNWEYLIETSSGLADGSAAMQLVSADGQSFDLSAEATYAHVGLWTALGGGTCSVGAPSG